MANTSISFCANLAYTSTIYARPCALIGCGVSFLGGSIGVQIQNQSALLSATLLRPKLNKKLPKGIAAGLASGRNAFAGGIYA